MISLRLAFLTALLLLLPLSDSTHHLHSLPILQLNPNAYPQADLILHNFRPQVHSSHRFRCLLQTESKYFYLDSSCQLFSRTSLKEICPLNYTLKLEIVLPQNTTVYQVVLQLKYPQPLQFNVSKYQTNLHLPFSCNDTQEFRLNSKRKDFAIGNAQIHLIEQKEEKTCQFEKNPYRVQLKENEVYGNFLQLKTLASCSSTNFRLASSNAKKNFEYFTLNASTGDLSLIKPFDYETLSTWKLVIQADDRFHIPFYTYVIIDVQDVNDCPPTLTWNFPLQTIDILNENDSFHVEIGIEESKVEQANVIIANLIASDLDASPTFDDGTKFELKFNSSTSLPFAIHGPFADSTFVLSTSERLDRETEEIFHLNLILTDQGQPRLSSSYKLTIRILDVNDNAPKFDQTVYRLEIDENQPLNTTLIHLQANDLDRDDNGRVSYELTESTNPFVTIERWTGIVRTAATFNYEEMKNFTFNVTARDHPKRGEPLRTTATIFVQIRDQNDNVPKFSQTNYEFSIYENNAPHTFLGQVFASDADQLSPLVYSLDRPSEEISSLFRVSPADGKIYISNPLDREQHDEFTFYVVASDGFHQSSRIKVLVHVLDLNDEIPRFVFPNDVNDTLIIDRTFWQNDEFICQIDVQDFDQTPNHSLFLVPSLNQLKNYDYIADEQTNFQFDSAKFLLDQQGKLFFNGSNGTSLNEGVYYLAFKIIDGQNYFDEKLLKLIVVDHYDRVQFIVKKYDSLGSHLNNRLSYLQYRSNDVHSKATSRQAFSPTSTLDQTNKFLVFIVITVLSIILIGISFIFISLIRRKSLQQKELLKKKDSISNASTLQPASESSTTNLYKPSSTNHLDKRQNLRVSNCYDYNEITAPSSLLMLNKESLAPTPSLNDNCCLLDKINEKEIYDEQRTKTYSSWVLSTSSNRPESRFSQRSGDSSTFHSLNRLSIPPQMHSPSNLSQQICSPKRHSSITYESTSVSSGTAHSHLPASSSSPTNNSPNTPVSSDDGFCGSSDISDPPLPTTNGSQTLIHQQSYRHQPYTMMKEGIMHKGQRSPSFTALINRLHDSSTLINATDTTRRVRFNLEPDDKHQQRTILPLPTSNSPGRLADHALRRFEQLYMTRDTVLDQQSIDSTILYTNSTVV